MSQQFIVLRCYKCETFQVGAVKKSNKWECKMCGSKQSVKVIFGKGTGKECRIHVQKLNMLRAEKDSLDQTIQSNNMLDNDGEDCSSKLDCSNSDILSSQNYVGASNFSVKHNESKDSDLKVDSRWCKYVEDDKVLKEYAENNVDIQDGVQYVLELPERKNKTKGKRNESNNACNLYFKPDSINYVKDYKKCNELFDVEVHDVLDLNKDSSDVDNENIKLGNHFGVASNLGNVLEDDEKEMCFESDFESNFDVAKKHNVLSDRKQCFKENKVASSSKWANYVNEEDLEGAAEKSNIFDSLVKKKNMPTQNNENILNFQSGNIGGRNFENKNNESVLFFDSGNIEGKVKGNENNFACKENNKSKEFLLSNFKQSRDDDNPNGCKKPKLFDSYFNEENTDLDNIFDI